MKKPSTAVLAGKAKGGKASKVAAPVTRVTVSDKRGAERSVEVRKIENGFILRESCYDPKKGYSSTERFVDKAPTLDVQAAKGKK